MLIDAYGNGEVFFGLIDAPLRWWQSFTAVLRGLGMHQSVLDPCVFYWYGNDDVTALKGVIALHVGDMIIGGDSSFHATVLHNLKKRYPFKDWAEGQGDFLGRRLTQLADYSIRIEQSTYAKNIQTIDIGRERGKERDHSIDDKETQQLRAVLGAANWLVGSSRPDIGVHTALLQQRVGTVSDLTEANKLVAKLRDFAHVSICVTFLLKIWLLVSSDASWSNTESLGSQAGYFIMVGDKRVEDGIWGDASVLSWKSYKLERRTQSTLGAEAELMGAARAIAEGDWMRSMIAEALNPSKSGLCAGT